MNEGGSCVAGGAVAFAGLSVRRSSKVPVQPLRESDDTLEGLIEEIEAELGEEGRSSSA